MYRLHQRVATESDPATSQLHRLPEELSLEVYHGRHPGRLPRLRATNGLDESRQWNESHNRPPTASETRSSPKAEVDRHPEVRLLRRRLRLMKKVFQDQKRSIVSTKGTPVYEEYQRAYRAHRNQKRRLEESLLKEVKARYKREQPVIDIQRQLKGLPVVDEETIETAAYVFVERVKVIDTLLAFVTPSLEEECKRRVEAINALPALCSLQEGRHFRRRKPSSSNTKLERDLTPPSVLQPPSLLDSIPIEYKPTQCIFCVGCEGLPTEARLKSFHTATAT